MGGSAREREFDAEEAQRIVEAEIARARAFYGDDAKGAAPLLPILHAIQDALGHVPEEAQPLLAEALNISRAELRGVVSFYHDFRANPPAARVLRLCRAEACQSMGVEALVAHLDGAHGLRAGEEGDPRIAVENVYCLGNCALAPAALVDGRLIGRLDAARLDALVAEARR